MNLAAVRTPEATALYLRTLPAIRDRCEGVFDLAKQDGLQHFTYHPDREPDVVKFCIDINAGARPASLRSSALTQPAAATLGQTTRRVSAPSSSRDRARLTRA